MKAALILIAFLCGWLSAYAATRLVLFCLDRRRAARYARAVRYARAAVRLDL